MYLNNVTSAAMSIFSYEQTDPDTVIISFVNGKSQTFHKQDLAPGETLIIGEGQIQFLKWESAPMSKEDWYDLFEQKHEGKKALYYPKEGVAKESKAFRTWYQKVGPSE
jgi:hypothetical protein